MVKLYIFLLSILISYKTFSASNNLFFTTAQFMTYCKSNNAYEQGICDGYIISINDVIYSLNKDHADLCIPNNMSIKKIRLSIVNFIIENGELMSYEANKVIAKYFLKNFKCQK